MFQAYTSQFIALVMFGLMMCEDRISMQKRRQEIIAGLKRLPGIFYLCSTYKHSLVLFCRYLKADDKPLM